MSDTTQSSTGDEYDQPGVNYPDREDAEGAEDTPGADEPQREEGGETPPGGASTTGPSHEAVGIGVVDDGHHHGQDEGRDTLTASAAQQAPGGLGTEQEQRLPAMAQNDAGDLEKIAGIVAQTRADVATEPIEAIEHALAQRLEQAGIEVGDTDVAELAQQISTGDAAGPRH